MPIISDDTKKLLEKQGYAFSGEHSAVKICHYTKKALRGEGTCYKNKFYGILSHRCLQMSPAVNLCQNQCIFCWREMELFTPAMITKPDDPDELVKRSIEMQRKLLSGFGGNPKVEKKLFEEALNPKHFAISLTGEPTTYPKLKEFIRALHNGGISTFLVSNGMLPDNLREILEYEAPTQLYLSVDAPNEKLFKAIDRPMFSDGWERLMRSLDLEKEFGEKTRTTLRMTLIKEMNMVEPENWAKAISRSKAMFVEVKGYMWVGASRKRMEMENMPSHDEVRDFSLKIAEHAGYKLIDEMPSARVVLLCRRDFKERIMDFSNDSWRTRPGEYEDYNRIN